MHGIEPESVAVFPGKSSTLAMAQTAFPGSLIGSGTPHFFAQFNRLEAVYPSDFLSFTVCPIVHSADDRTPMAGLQSLPSMLATARARHPGCRFRVGPSNLGARDSPLGTLAASDGMRRVALAGRDPRTRGLYGAAWLLGHLAWAAQAGAEAVTVMSLRGDAGVLTETQDGQVLLHPPYFVLAKLARLKCQKWTSVSGPPGVVALPGERVGHQEWLVANLTSQSVDSPLGESLSGCVMDAAAWQAYARGDATSPWRSLPLGGAGVFPLDAFAVALLQPAVGANGRGKASKCQSNCETAILRL